MQAPVIEESLGPHQPYQAAPPPLFGQHICRLASRVPDRVDLALQRKPLLPLAIHGIDQAVPRLRLREEPMHPGLRVHRQIKLFNKRPVPRILRRDRESKERDRTEQCPERPHRLAARPALVLFPSPLAHAGTLMSGGTSAGAAATSAASSFRARSLFAASARSMTVCICSAVMASPLATVNSRFSRMVRSPNSSASTI